MSISFPASPVTLTHTLLGMLPEPGTYPLLKPDEGLALIVPVYNEQDFLMETLDAAIISQHERPDQVIISQNGSKDRTAEVISFFLSSYGYSSKGVVTANEDFRVEQYHSEGLPPILVKDHSRQTSKAEGANTALPFIEEPWSLVIDSDTVLAPAYIEEMKRARYRIHVGSGGADIQKCNNLGGTVFTKLRKRAGIEERIIAMAREAEYTSGQLVVRRGQNWTALYVTPGCGIVCDTPNLKFPDNTVTEDLENTVNIQLNRSTRHLSADDINRLCDSGFYVETEKGLEVPLEDFIFESNLHKISYTENTSRYVPGAMMYTQDPTNMKGFLNQLDRWVRGGHQVRLTRGRDIDKSLRASFTYYGGFAEGLFNSLIFFGLPLAGLAYQAAGVGLAPSALAITYGLDFVLQSGMVMYGMFQRARMYGLDREESLGYAAVNSLQNVGVQYFNRLLNSVIFMSTYFETLKEVAIDKRTKWGSSWVRPHANVARKASSSRIAEALDDAVKSVGFYATTSRKVISAYMGFGGISGRPDQDTKAEISRVYRDVFLGDGAEMAQTLSDTLFRDYFRKMIQAGPKSLMRTDVMEYDWMIENLHADGLRDFMRRMDESDITRQRDAGFRMRMAKELGVGK